jgi:hypothetical protein
MQEGGHIQMQRRKRPFVVGVLAAGVVVAVAVLGTLGYASADGANAAPAQYQYQGPQQDAVEGSGKIRVQDFPTPGEVLVEQYIVSAHSGPAGEDPDGQITFHSPLVEDGHAKADVTCMNVVGNHAQVGGMFRESITYFGFKIRWIEVIVDDNGSPGPAGDNMTAVVFFDRPRPPGFSPCNFVFPTEFQVEQGNFDVRDGTERGSNRMR